MYVFTYWCVNIFYLLIFILVVEGDQLGNKAYRLRITDDEDEDSAISAISRRLSHLHLSECQYNSDGESEGFSDSGEDELSHTHSPPPDDTKSQYYKTIQVLM